MTEDNKEKSVYEMSNEELKEVLQGVSTQELEQEAQAQLEEVRKGCQECAEDARQVAYLARKAAQLQLGIPGTSQVTTGGGTVKKMNTFPFLLPKEILGQIKDSTPNIHEFKPSRDWLPQKGEWPWSKKKV